MSSKFALRSIALWWAVTGVSIATAQDATTMLNELYGRGVHAYYQGDYDRAQRFFDTAVAHGSRDPRCYYFRGLTLDKLGRAEEATEQFQIGAKYEYAPEATYDVPRALERIQGPERLRLEQIRREMRLTAMTRPRPPRPAQRYAAPPTPRDTEGAGSVVQAGTEEPINLPPNANDPFAEDTAGPIGAGKIEKATVPTPTEPSPPADTSSNALADDPFGTERGVDASGTTPPDDPFGTAPSTPANAGGVASGGGPNAENRGQMLRSLFNAVTKSVPGTGEGAGGTETPPSGAPASDPFGGLGATPASDATGKPGGEPAISTLIRKIGELPGKVLSGQSEPQQAQVGPAPGTPGPAAGGPNNGPAAPPQTAPQDDPFGGGAGDDPFGNVPAPAPGGNAAGDPFGNAPAPAPGGNAAGDPFGNAPAPAPGGNAAGDPFGNVPAPAPGGNAADDPFGNVPTTDAQETSADASTSQDGATNQPAQGSDEEKDPFADDPF